MITVDSPAGRRKVAREAALKVLRDTPERYKRERIYEAMDAVDPANVALLREAMGDDDDNRDTMGPGAP